MDKLPQPKQRVITIENLQGGWVSDYTDANHPREGQPNQYGYSFGMSTMRPGRKGHITPAEIFNGASVTDTDGDINSLPVGVSVDNSRRTKSRMVHYGRTFRNCSKSSSGC